VKAVLPEAKAIFHKTRGFRPLIKDILKQREIQELVRQLVDRTKLEHRIPSISDVED
jgi:hypothetical protein